MQYLFLALTGAFAGTLGGLFGIGGGIVIVPALYVVFTSVGADPEIAFKTAVGTSLATIIVTSLRSMRSHHLRGAVDFSVLQLWGPFIALGAVAGAGLARFISGEALTVIFALGVIGMGTHRIIGKKDRPSDDKRALDFSSSVQRGMAVATGTFSSLMGIGGGVIGVLLLTLGGRPIHQAVGTASGFGIAIAIPGAIAFALLGLSQETLDGAIGFVHLPGFVAVALGTLIFVPLGASLAHRLPGAYLSVGFGIYMLITGVLLLREAFFGA
ncbi:MAG: sulfite exporter TauE/SafE family protein [Pseudomonadota bacterium]